MSLHIIKKGQHREEGLHIGLYSRDLFKYAVEFNQTAVCNLGPNQLDINKLCGIRYFKGDNSARFGWRYCSGKVDLMAYVHDDQYGVTKSDKEIQLGRLSLDRTYYPVLTVLENVYVFSERTLGSVRVPKSHDQKWSFRQGLYHGGEKVAPHDIKVEIQTFR